jgi:hypothetical protein
VRPYLAVGLGYGSGSLEIEHHRDGHRLLVEGSGGGEFGTLAIGGSISVWSVVSVFFEGSTLTTPDNGWDRFCDDERVSGDIVALGHLAQFDRRLYVYGYQACIGMEIAIR